MPRGLVVLLLLLLLLLLHEHRYLMLPRCRQLLHALRLHMLRVHVLLRVLLRVLQRLVLQRWLYQAGAVWELRRQLRRLRSWGKGRGRMLVGSCSSLR